MIELQRPQTRRRTENTIPLINIVFLLLIFFLVAGTLAPPADPAIALIATEQADPSEAAELAGLRADGTLMMAGGPATPEQVVDAFAADGDNPTLYLAVDRNAPAHRLLDVVADLRAAGAASVIVITERGAP